ncbi:hypothetical protein BDB00DRAFT_926392 [Zychaea mexicana]|uniref:uncharacterized protein n=1 Tax=Zychaea mexicana TaxID=64656 RepID=UPI0022FE4C9D|nr:uncharacterized protein BDB00DRAFT_926392 [Zychaea mexicana]KAI9496819.1 hypothetical protein BDB00DRAFT_926392 [Zychaea mexicana]
MSLHYHTLSLAIRAIVTLIIAGKLQLNHKYFFPILLAAIASTFALDGMIIFQGYDGRNILFNKRHPFHHSQSLPLALQLLTILQANLVWLAAAVNLLLSREGILWIKAHLRQFKATVIGIAVSAVGSYYLRYQVDFYYMQCFQQCITVAYAGAWAYALLVHWRHHEQKQHLSAVLLAYGIVTLLQPVQGTLDSITILFSYRAQDALLAYEPLIQKPLPVLSFSVYFFEIQTPLIVLLLTLRSGPDWATRQVQQPPSDIEKGAVATTGMSSKQ